MADASAWKVELEAEGDAWKAKQDAHAEQTSRHVDEIAELYTMAGEAPTGNPNSLDTARDCVTAGTGTAYTATFAPAFASLVNGIELKVRWHADSGENPTLNLNGLGAKAIVQPDGNAPAAAALKQNHTGQVIYNATLDKWVLVSNVPPILPSPLSVVAAKTTNYALQASDLADGVTIVPIDISSGDVDITELGLASMNGIVRYVITAWDGAGATHKARLLDDSDQEIWTGFAASDFITCVYDGTTRTILAEDVTAFGFITLDVDYNRSTSEGNLWPGSSSTLHENCGALFDYTTNYRIDLPFPCLIRLYGRVAKDDTQNAYFRVYDDGSNVLI
ncbi:MAG: hypothetical protein DWQ08_13580, partial [Proteobacteria bacterium]